MANLPSRTSYSFCALAGQVMRPRRPTYDKILKLGLDFLGLHCHGCRVFGIEASFYRVLVAYFAAIFLQLVYLAVSLSWQVVGYWDIYWKRPTYSSCSCTSEVFCLNFQYPELIQSAELRQDQRQVLCRFCLMSL